MELVERYFRLNNTYWLLAMKANIAAEKYGQKDIRTKWAAFRARRVYNKLVAIDQSISNHNRRCLYGNYQSKL